MCGAVIGTSTASRGCTNMSSTRTFLLIFSLFDIYRFVVRATAAVSGRVGRGQRSPSAVRTVILETKPPVPNATGTTDAKGVSPSRQVPQAISRSSHLSNGFGRYAETLSTAGSEVVFDAQPGPIQETNSHSNPHAGQLGRHGCAVSVVAGKRRTEQVNTIGDIFRTLPGTSTSCEGPFGIRPRIRGWKATVSLSWSTVNA